MRVGMAFFAAGRTVRATLMLRRRNRFRERDCGGCPKLVLASMAPKEPFSKMEDADYIPIPKTATGTVYLQASTLGAFTPQFVRR